MAKARAAPRGDPAGTRRADERREPEISFSDLERAYTFFAWAVITHGVVYAPLLERMEREILEARRSLDVMDRARQALERHTLDGGLKAIR